MGGYKVQFNPPSSHTLWGKIYRGEIGEGNLYTTPNIPKSCENPLFQSTIPLYLKICLSVCQLRYPKGLFFFREVGKGFKLNFKKLKVQLLKYGQRKNYTPPPLIQYSNRRGGAMLQFYQNIKFGQCNHKIGCRNGNGCFYPRKFQLNCLYFNISAKFNLLITHSQRQVWPYLR